MPGMRPDERWAANRASALASPAASALVHSRFGAVTCGFRRALTFAYIYEGTTRHRVNDLLQMLGPLVSAGQAAFPTDWPALGIRTNHGSQTSSFASLQSLTGAVCGNPAVTIRFASAQQWLVSGARGTVTSAHKFDVPESVEVR